MVQKCLHCNNFYNLTNRKALVLQCGCTYCEECIQSLLNENKEKQEIICPEKCKEVSTRPELKESKQIYNSLQQQDELTILCDQHPNNTTTMYCLDCEIPVCSDCKLVTHKVHSLINLKKSMFKNYSENVKTMFEENSDKNLMSQLDKYSKNEVQPTASQFKSTIFKINRMFQHLPDEERIKIDLVSCLNGPRKFLENAQSAQELIPSGYSSMGKHEKSMMKVKQVYQREELKQGLIYNNLDQSKKEKRQNDSIKLPKTDINSRINHQLEFKKEFSNDQDQRFKEIDQQVDTRLCILEENFQKSIQEIKSYQNEIKLLKEQLNEQKVNIESMEKSLSELQASQGIQRESEQQVIRNDYLEDGRIESFRNLVDQEINQTDASFLKDQLKYEIFSPKFKLLYKGSHHGFTASKFHELCDNKGPTICFILSESGQVFGGYTSVPWTSPYWMKNWVFKSEWRSDGPAFVFSLTNRTVHKQYKNQEKAVQHHSSKMCSFGDGDIDIQDNCDKNNHSSCSLGGISVEPKFRVLEIEFYSVNPIIL
eukprot:403376820